MNSTNVINGHMRVAAGQVGWSSLLMFVLSMFGVGVMKTVLIDLQQRDTTLANLALHKDFFALGILSMVVVAICDVIVAVGLRRLLLPMGRMRSDLVAGLRLAYVLGFSVALGCWIYSLLLINRGEMAEAWDGLVWFEGIFQGSLVVFGVHLGLLGWWGRDAGWMPRWIAYVLVMAGPAYIGSSLANLTLPDGNALRTALGAVVAVVAILGEVGLAIVLLVRRRSWPRT